MRRRDRAERRVPTGARRPAGAASDAQRSPAAQVRRAAGLEACSRRSRARRRPPRPRRRCTSRRRRRASASSRARAERRPSSSTRAPVAPPVGRAWSGAVQCVWCPSGPRDAASVRALEPRRLVLSGLGVGRPHERRDGEAARPCAPAARRSAPTPRRRAVAQRGRTRPRTVPATWRPSSSKYRRPPR